MKRSMRGWFFLLACVHVAVAMRFVVGAFCGRANDLEFARDMSVAAMAVSLNLAALVIIREGRKS